MCRMRRRRSEDSLVGSTTRSSSASPVGAAAAGASSTGAEGEAVEEDRTAVYGSLRAEAGLRGGNPDREAAAGRWRGDEGKSEPWWGWERSNGAEADGAAIVSRAGRRRARGACGGRSAVPSSLARRTLPRLDFGYRSAEPRSGSLLGRKMTRCRRTLKQTRFNCCVQTEFRGKRVQVSLQNV